MTIDEISENCLYKIKDILTSYFPPTEAVAALPVNPQAMTAIKTAILQYHSDMVIEDNPMKDDWKRDLFEDFYEKYDKKVGKAPAWKKFSKLKRVDIERIMETVEAFVTVNNDPKYRPNPLTYINQRRWEDSLPENLVPKQKRRVISDSSQWDYSSL